MDPRELARVYERAHDFASAAMDRGILPADIKETWPNMLGFLRRVPGTPYHRPPCNGIDDKPSDAEIETFAAALKIHARRAERQFNLYAQGARCGHLEGKARSGVYVSGEECECSDEAAGAQTHVVGRAEREAWRKGYEHGYLLGACGEPLGTFLEKADLP